LEEIAIKWWRSSKPASGEAPRKPERPEPPAGTDPDRGGGRSPEDERLLDRLAEFAVARRMTVPAILFLESVKPLSFLGSQALYFFEPMVRALFTVPEYERFAALMERRENIEVLLVKIEEKDEKARRAERERKAQERAARDAARKGKGAP
jgi:hypothetical protein